jgi:hypothetical protein
MASTSRPSSLQAVAIRSTTSYRLHLCTVISKRPRYFGYAVFVLQTPTAQLSATINLSIRVYGTPRWGTSVNLLICRLYRRLCLSIFFRISVFTNASMWYVYHTGVLAVWFIIGRLFPRSKATQATSMFEKDVRLVCVQIPVNDHVVRISLELLSVIFLRPVMMKQLT